MKIKKKGMDPFFLQLFTFVVITSVIRFISIVSFFVVVTRIITISVIITISHISSLPLILWIIIHIKYIHIILINWK